MRRKEVVPLSSLLKDLIKAFKIEDKLDEVEIIHAWPKIVDKKVLACTLEISYARGLVRVQLSSPVLRAELNMRRTKLIEDLNKVCKANIVKEIHFK